MKIRYFNQCVLVTFVSKGSLSKQVDRRHKKKQTRQKSVPNSALHTFQLFDRLLLLTCYL